MVRGDEARHDDRARAIDHFGIAGGEVGRDLGDQLSVDQDVGPLEVPTRGSRLSTTPPRSRMRRLRPSPMRSWGPAVVARHPVNCAGARKRRRAPLPWPSGTRGETEDSLT